MISGAHTIIYSNNAEADKAFFLEVLRFPHVDIGHGWLIFALPPAEMAVHPAGTSGAQEFYLICDSIEEFLAEMKKNNITCSPVMNERWGILTHITLPGGSQLGVYEPKHARP